MRSTALPAGATAQVHAPESHELAERPSSAPGRLPSQPGRSAPSSPSTASSQPSGTASHIVPEGLQRRSSGASQRSAGGAAEGAGGERSSAPSRASSTTAPRQTALPSRPASPTSTGRVPSQPVVTTQPTSSGPHPTDTTAAPQRDEALDLTRTMPGAFDPLPASQLVRTPPPTVTRAPGGLASLHAATVPSFRDVNPRIDLNALAQRLPQDVQGCVAYMLSSMRTSPADIPALEQLATRQAQTLESRGIRTRDDFIGLLGQVQWRDAGTSVLHGMAGANGFNVGSAVVNFAAADLTLTALFKALPQLPTAVPGFIAGAALGFALSVMDVAAGASAGKTFGDAYFTRPPEDRLPAPLHGANPPTKTSMAVDTTIAAGLSYGAVRNGGVRIPLTLGLELSGQPVKRALADNIADPVGGSILGGGGMRAIRNDRDVGAGRAGFQHFLARDDLGACVDHLQKPGIEQIESAARRALDYVKNVGVTLPEAMGDAFASKVGWTSHAILAPGFGGLFAMLTSLPGQLKDRNWSETEANLATQMLKFVALQGLYHLWGGALGAVAGPRAPAQGAGANAAV